jgi:peptidoglycan hydrolase CwlO-like protein
MNILKTSIGIALATVMTAQATTLDNARSIENKSNTASAVSQIQIDKSSEATLAYKAEIEQLQEEVKNLTVYRDHLTGLVNSQQQEMGNLNNQIETIKETRQATTY